MCCASISETVTFTIVALGAAGCNPYQWRSPMRTIKIIEHITLDGIIQAPGGPGEDGDYPYGGWAGPHADTDGGAAIVAAHGEAFDLLLGRRTYDIWTGFWQKAP